MTIRPITDSRILRKLQELEQEQRKVEAAPEPDPIFVQLAADIARPGALSVLLDAAAERGWMVIELDSVSLPHLLWCPPLDHAGLRAWIASWQQQLQLKHIGTWVTDHAPGGQHPLLTEMDTTGSGRLPFPSAARDEVRRRLWRVECHRRKGLLLHEPGDPPARPHVNRRERRRPWWQLW